MRLHADFSQTVIIYPKDAQWVQSPNAEVSRMMLDRIGEEQARATSLVKFAAQSTFPEHTHPLGEEVLVLSGVFTENTTQHYPAGWYMRNPHQSAHQVSSESGCLIFVKLMQMTEDELTPTRINTRDPQHWLWQDDQYICPLFSAKHERTYLIRLSAQQQLSEQSDQGIEILILSGELVPHCEHFATGTWLRLAANRAMQLFAGASGASLYIKSGHLQHAIHVWGSHTSSEIGSFKQQ